jgi:hypothetical protein
MAGCTVVPPEPARVLEPIVNEQSIFSFGADRTLDVFFGPDGAGGVVQKRGPVGQKVVVVGQNFYLARGKTGLPITAYDPAVPEPDRQWSWWYHDVKNGLAENWKGSFPGLCQVILQITPDRKITIEKEIAFVPALSKDGQFDTSRQTHTAFVADIKKCTEEFSKKMPAFPAQVDGQPLFKSATFVATFSADRNLFVAMPNLYILQGLPTDQKSQWIARLCKILEAGFLYQEADALKAKLPKVLRQPFIPSENFAHSLEPTNYGPGCGGLWSMWTGRELSQQSSEKLIALLNAYIEANRYVEAEALAEAVARDNNAEGLFFYGLSPSQIDQLKQEVEDALKKGYINMDWNNTKEPPPEAARGMLLPYKED